MYGTAAAPGATPDPIPIDAPGTTPGSGVQPGNVMYGTGAPGPAPGAPGANPGAASGWGGANPPTAPNQWGAGNVATVGAPPVPAEYAAYLQQAYAPFFKQQQSALNANQAALGTLTSGAGNYGQQEFAAQNAATLAQGELPLIQQGFGQQFAANSQNAGAANSLLQMLQDQGFQASQNNADRALQASEFNTGAQNNYYSQGLSDLYGLTGQGLSGISNLYGQAPGLEQGGYQYGGQQGAQAGQGIGSALGGMNWSQIMASLFGGGGAAGTTGHGTS